METTNKYLKFIVIFSLLLLVAVLSQNKLLAIIAALGFSANTCFSIMDWRKRANAEHFYNKQGQECTKQEMEAELKWKLTPNREIPEEEAFD